MVEASRESATKDAALSLWLCLNNNSPDTSIMGGDRAYEYSYIAF